MGQLCETGALGSQGRPLMPILHFYKGKTPSVPAGIFLKLGEHVLTGEKNFSDNFGPTTTLEADLLTLAAAIFAADRGCLRGEREDFSRSLELHVPVVNVGRLLPLATKVEEILRTLSNDNWTLNLRQENGTCEPAHPKKLGAGKVLLFSGGLDSLAAALEFSSEKTPLALISHVTRNPQMAKAQILLKDAVEAKGANIEHHTFFRSEE